MKKYSVQQLSRLAGVSVRTLHHYDQIGLLKPAERSEKNYRFYGKAELLKLQQILFYKELEFSLKDIAKILNDPDFDFLTALEFHQVKLLRKADRVQQLLTTIDKTIHSLKNKNTNMKDQELYKGFSQEEITSMRNEVKKRWGANELLEVEERIRQLGSEGWDDHQAKGEEINHLLADLMEIHPAEKQVQQAVAMHFKHLNFYYKVSKERYEGLGKMYVEDERFKAHYDQYKEGLAIFLRDAIFIFCQNDLKVIE